MKNLKNQIKWAYQRIIRGYDDRIYWEFDTYFDRFINPLEKFCLGELAKEHIKLNPIREEVFKETLRLVHEYKNSTDEDFYKQDNPTNKLWGYMGKNITHYWN